MSVALASLAALAVSICAVLYLLAIDNKRRRVFRITRSSGLPRSRAAGWIMVLLPGTLLIASGQTSAFLVWCGTVTVCSWLIVSRPPRRL